jgi:hypothetical protein
VGQGVRHIGRMRMTRIVYRILMRKYLGKYPLQSLSRRQEDNILTGSLGDER